VTKGEETRRTILDGAVMLARKVGFEGLSIGLLAEHLSLSKSGLFAHFGSKEALQVAVIDHAREQFIADVMAPALKAQRGEPRLRALVNRWFVWGKDEGGCLFIALAAELDDRPGPAREALASTQRDWLDSLATATKMAIEEKHFKADVDPQQVAFELYGIMLAQHNISRLLDDASIAHRAKQAVHALMARCRRD
jgi:AcrR family transcriptional regulator